jgi:putative restriction endonuclease
MDLFVGVTDGDWYELLASTPGLDEVNFWQPGGNHQFKALSPGEMFLFKLHSPDNFIVGGGVFATSSLLPTSLAWEAFGIGNGATTIVEMRARIEKYRKQRPAPHEDYRIGCIILTQPFFLPRDRWIPVPTSWKPNIVQGKGYARDEVEGRALWRAVEDALRGLRADAIPVMASAGLPTAEPAERFGQPALVRPRLGQGSFRVVVTDAYDRRCAITKERTLPVLEAAHIRPYADGGEHRIDNGLLLRRDLHTLFDRGYLTVTPDLKLDVSRRLKDDWENGREYYALQGRELWLPKAVGERPRAEYLEWHREERWLG